MLVRLIQIAFANELQKNRDDDKVVLIRTVA